MAELTSQTTFTILAAPEIFEETADLYLLPENSGINAMREMHYPGGKYPPIIYSTNPYKWENFDSAPLTDRPQVKSEMTLSSVQIVHWRGYTPDKPVKEYWPGSDTISWMDAYMLRRLYEYYVDPPDDDYIIWYPKDRTEQGYKIKLESVSVGGQDIIMFLDPAIRADIIPFEVVVQFRIVEEYNP
jgi:hypothetical protein